MSARDLPTILVGVGQLIDADPRVQRIFDQLEAEIEQAVSEAKERAQRSLDTLEGVDRLRPYRQAIETEIAAHPDVYDGLVALRVLREAQGRTVASVAHEIGRDRRTLAGWERTPGRGARFNYRDMQVYCAALSVNPVAFIFLLDGIHERKVVTA